MTRKTIIWGASGHARVVADILKLTGEYELVGFLDDVNPDRAGTSFCGLPVLGGKERLVELPDLRITHVIFGFGDCAMRLRLSEWVRSKGFTLAEAIHPKAIIAEGCPIGAGTVIAAGVVVNPGAIIGENVILNTSSSVDHDTVIEDGVHICPGARLAGNVTVGRGAWVGISTTVIERVRIGTRSMIGAGAVVVNDIPEGVLAYGNPAKIIRKVKNDY